LWAALLERSPELLNATGALLWPLLLPMLVGSLPLGLLAGAIVYYISRKLTRGWQPTSPYDSATRLSRDNV